MGDSGRGNEAARPLEPFNPHALMRWQCRLLLVLITRAEVAEICQSKAGMANVVTKYSYRQAKTGIRTEEDEGELMIPSSSIRAGLLEGLDIIVTSASAMWTFFAPGRNISTWA